MERKASQKKIDYNSNYSKTHYTQVSFRVRKGQRELIQNYAERKGMSVSAYINALIAADMGEEFNTDTTAGSEP